MKIPFLAAALTLALPALATQNAMEQALNAWNARLNEYKAAVQQAPTEEAKAAVAMPDGLDIAPALWQSVCGVTATRQEEVRGKKKGEKQLRSVRSYEFQQAWAAPAVVWFLNRPEALTAAIGADKPEQVTAFTELMKKSLAEVHYLAPEMADVCATLAAGTSVDEYDTLEKIYTRNQNKNARACAAMAMSLMLSNPMVQGIAGSEAMVRGKRVYYLKQALLLSDDNTVFGGEMLTEVAKEQAYRLRRLSVGCVPPQMKLRDAQGKEQTFPKPGKLNLLFFWSPQESVGSGLIARMANLQKKYPELEICPITPAPAEGDTEHPAAPEGITLYTDDAKGTAGRDYRINVVPTAVLLAPNSTILYIGYPDMRLQSALENAARPAAPAEGKRGTIIIKDGSEEQPVIQPGSVPKTAPAPAADVPPGLRDMPEFK